jgi:hypothetical protein
MARNPAPGQRRPHRVQQVPGEAEEQEGVGVAVQHRVQPTAVVAAQVLEPGDLAVAAVDDGGHLGQHAPRRQGRVAAQHEEPGGRQREPEAEEGDLVGRHRQPRQPPGEADGEGPVEPARHRPVPVLAAGTRQQGLLRPFQGRLVVQVAPEAAAHLQGQGPAAGRQPAHAAGKAGVALRLRLAQGGEEPRRGQEEAGVEAVVPLQPLADLHDAVALAPHPGHVFRVHQGVETVAVHGQAQAALRHAGLDQPSYQLRVEEVVRHQQQEGLLERPLRRQHRGAVAGLPPARVVHRGDGHVQAARQLLQEGPQAPFPVSCDHHKIIRPGGARGADGSLDEWHPQEGEQRLAVSPPPQPAAAPCCQYQALHGACPPRRR